MIYNYINCFGDSLTTGARDPDNLNYGFWLSKALSESKLYKARWYSIIRAVNGFKVVDVHKNIYDWCKGTPETKITLLLIGSNDCKGKGTPVTIFSALYQQIVDVCLISRKKLVLATLPPIVPSAMPEWFSPKVDELRQEYNQIIRERAKACNLPFCELNGFEEKYLVDGIHLTSEGNSELARRWLKVITSEGFHGEL